MGLDVLKIICRQQNKCNCNDNFCPSQGKNCCGEKKLLVTRLLAFSPFPNIFLKSSSFREVNILPNDKILDCSKLKAFADDKINVTKELKFV